MKYDIFYCDEKLDTVEARSSTEAMEKVVAQYNWEIRKVED